MNLALLRSILILRCFLSVAMAYYLATVRLSASPSFLRGLGYLSAIDGVLALGLAVLILAAGWYRALAGLAAVDGLVRICAALAVWLGHGMANFSLTIVLYIGVLATLGFLIGLMRLSAARKLYGKLGNPWTPILIAQGLVVTALAVVAFVAAANPVRAGRWLAFVELIDAIALFAVALRVGQPAGRSVAAHSEG